jgi:hypothetical protein
MNKSASLLLLFNHKYLWRIFMGGIIFFVMLFAVSSPVKAGNDFVDTELRIDLFSVYQSRDYIHTLFVGGNPSGGSGAYTTAWLGVNLAQFTGEPYSALFSQVGFITDSIGVKWFVYSEAGVQCLQGNPAWGDLGCVGNYGELATIGNWQNVELVTYGEGFWIARIYDQYGSPFDVAKFMVDSLRIYRATVATEEAYSGESDPYILASFWHNHPKYMIWGYGFQDWVASSGGNNNYLFTSPPGICPDHYVAKLNWFGDDPRIWFAGSAGPSPATCSVNPIF